MIYQGYLFAASGGGTYTITSPVNYIDDVGLAWAGVKTLGNDWNYGNADYVAEHPGGGSVTITLVAGEALPVTFFWANVGGPGQSAFSVITPDGVQHDDTTGFYVQDCGSGLFTP